MSEPMKLEVTLSKDGDQFVVLYGENLQVGVAGYGETIEEAFADFGSAICDEPFVTINFIEESSEGENE